jgi:hypothetical protein
MLIPLLKVTAKPQLVLFIVMMMLKIFLYSTLNILNYYNDFSAPPPPFCTSRIAGFQEQQSSSSEIKRIPEKLGPNPKWLNRCH